MKGARIVAFISSVGLSLLLGTSVAGAAQATPATGRIVWTTAAGPLDEAHPELPSAGTFANVDYLALAHQFSAIDKVAKSYPRADGGAYFNEATGRVYVRFVPGGDGDRLVLDIRALPANEGDVAVDFVPVNISMTQLHDAAATLEADPDWALQHKGSVFGVRVDEYRARLRIDVRDSGEELSRLAEEATGIAPMIVVTKGPIVPQKTRRDDNSPFYGGLAVWSASQASPVATQAECTPAFRMLLNGSPRIVGARHCTGEYWNATTQVFTARAGIGSTDAALFTPSQTFANYVWWGTQNTTGFRRVTAALSNDYPVLGSAAYVSGANGGLTYGVWGGYNSSCFVSGAYQSLRVLDTTGGGATIPGDSGAPVSRWNTSTGVTDDVVALGVNNCGNGQDTSLITQMYTITLLSGAVVGTVVP